MNALLRSNPAAAASLSADDPRVAHALAMAEFRQKGGEVSKQNLQLVAQSLRRAPLAEEPFVLSGLQALVRENTSASERLLLEAMRRNPRSRATRLLLLDRYMKTGRIDAAAREIAVLNRLIPEANQVLIPELSKFAGDPKARGALGRTLRNDPLLQQEILKHLAISGAAPETVLSLARASESPLTKAAANEWQGILVQKLVEKSEISRAYSIWSRFLGSSHAGGRKSGVYDGNFERKPGSPPFNWQLTGGGAGVAEIAARGGLQVEYYGRVRTDLASQVLMLDPGTHRLTFSAEGEASGKSSYLAWRVECIPSKAEAGEVPIRNLSFARKVLSGKFTVPASGCGSQWLRLVGMPAEFPEGQSATIRDLRIERGGQ